MSMRDTKRTDAVSLPTLYAHAHLDEQRIQIHAGSREIVQTLPGGRLAVVVGVNSPWMSVVPQLWLRQSKNGDG